MSRVDLQVLPKGKENVTENWEYVRPRPGCALINVGDSLMKWTGGVLHSAFHRVVTAPGEQANVARQSVALLTRPHRTVTMHRLKESAVITLLREGEVNDDRSVSEWMIWKITKGELRVQTAEGKQVKINGFLAEYKSNENASLAPNAYAQNAK
ncbi:hypothetical protein AnigIFM60653_004898 [Aspergillus niger]|nr:hypothetical protein AnigIFM50267_002661 [Aspergillus niger]GLA04835.1 hypothetical protein AnigIFM60653_004898 [Aspergillus niger]